MTSHLGGVWESQQGVAPGTPTYGTYGTDGESACEGANLSDRNAREHEPIRTLVRALNCRYCGSPIYVAICTDGRWRSFDTRTTAAATAGVWAWRKHQGMQEQELVPGKQLHFCAEYAQPRPEEVLP